MVANLLILTTVGLTVLADPMEVFSLGDDNRYLAANALLPVAASMGTSLILRAFFSGPEPVAQSAESSRATLLMVGMMVGEHHKGLILGWAFKWSSSGCAKGTSRKFTSSISLSTSSGTPPRPRC